MINESFSIRLREARQMMGLSMDKLVERTNGAITKQSISRFLRHSQIFEQLFVLINTKEVFWNMQALKYR